MSKTNTDKHWHCSALKHTWYSGAHVWWIQWCCHYIILREIVLCLLSNYWSCSFIPSHSNTMSQDLKMFKICLIVYVSCVKFWFIYKIESCDMYSTEMIEKENTYYYWVPAMWYLYFIHWNLLIGSLPLSPPLWSNQVSLQDFSIFLPFQIPKSIPSPNFCAPN